MKLLGPLLAVITLAAAAAVWLLPNPPAEVQRTADELLEVNPR